MLKIIDGRIRSNKELKDTNKPLILIIRDTKSNNCTINDIDTKEKNEGLSMINSHFFVSSKGYIFRGRPETVPLECKRLMDGFSLMIDVEGDFNTTEMNTLQENALVKLCKYIKEKYTKIDRIFAYNEFFKDETTPGVMFPLNKINALVMNKNSTMSISIPEKVKTIKYTNFYSPQLIYTYKSRTLKMAIPEIKGNDVLILKIKLSELGISINKLSDKFDRETEMAVNHVKKILKLPQNGIADVNFMDRVDYLLNKRFNVQKDTSVYTRLIELRNPYMRGEDIKKIQEILSNLDLYDGDNHGLFDFKTSTSVKNFQIINGIEADGKVGPRTFEKIMSSLKIKFTRSIFLKEPLMEGKDIKIIQKQLIELGYEIDVTSYYDYPTYEAIRNLQNKNALIPNGVINETTFNLIFNIKEY